MVNKAIAAAWADVKSHFAGTAAQAAFNAAVGNTVIPWIDFNPDTNRFFLTADDKLFNDELEVITNHNMKLVFNDRLYELFASLPFRLIDTQNDLDWLQYNAGRVSPWYSIRFVNRSTGTTTDTCRKL